MVGEVSIESDIYFFPIEDTEDDVVIEREGVIYRQIFPLEFGVEIYSYFEDEFEKRNYSELDKAKRLLHYIINDA